MKEQEVERVLNAYAESLGHCERRLAKPHRNAWARRATLLVAGGTAVAVAFLVLRPADAVAATLQRVSLAINNAKTMEATSWVQLPSGRWYESLHIFYKEGMWTLDVQKSTSWRIRHTARDGKLLTNYASLDHATLQPYDDHLFMEIKGDSIDALDFVKQHINTGHISIEREVTIIENQLHQGKPAYKIVFERAEDQYRAELLVDKASNLPISSKTSVVYDLQSGRVQQHVRQNYKFNHPIADEVFSLKPGKPVVDTRKAEAELNKKWKDAILKVGASSIRDVMATADGTVWIVTTANFEGNGPIALPDTITTDAGAPYILAQDIPPSAIMARTYVATMAGDSIVISMYVPLTAPARQASSVRVQFAERKVRWAGFAQEPDTGVPVGKAAQFKVRPESGDRPSYFPGLDLDHFGFQLGITKWNAIGEAFEKKLKWLEAARAYEECVQAYEKFVKYTGYRPMQKAAACYRKAGMLAKADALDEAALELKASRER